MRLILITILLIISSSIFCQSLPGDSSSQINIQYPVKGYILKSDHNKINFIGLTLVDNNSIKIFSQGPNKVGNTYTYKGDPRTITLVTLPVADIKLLKVNRSAFLEGAIVGGVIGGALGYAGGYITYTDRFDIPTEDNKER